MHISLIFAGHLLARLGRPEVMNCINGLKQYSYAYEESGDQANEIHRAFNRARGGELELNHMASTASANESCARYSAQFTNKSCGRSAATPQAERPFPCS
jgi:hypothetical protein